MIPGLPRSLLRVLARTLAGLLLFGQLVTAAHACAFTTHRPGAAATTASAAAHCHQAPASDPGALCERHCNADEQSPSAAPVGVAPMPAIAVLIVPAIAPAVRSAANGIASARAIAPATDPPPSILFHAFRS